MQVNPIKSTLKALGTKRLKLEYAEPLSNFAFEFNLRRYTKGVDEVYPNLNPLLGDVDVGTKVGPQFEQMYEVGRCRLN